MNLAFGMTSAVLCLLIAGWLTAVLKLSTRTERLLVMYLIAYAQIVLVAQIAGTVYQLGNTTFWITVQAVLAGIAASVWWRRGMPRLHVLPDFKSWHVRIFFQDHPYLLLLAVGVIAAYAVAIVLILVVPPNNTDGMGYRLPRVAYWLQHDSFFPWQTDNPRQTAFPQNAEIGVLWTFLVRGSDQLAGLVQWSAAVVLMGVVYSLGRRLNYKPAECLFAALVWATLPIVFTEATTVQNDLVVTAFFVLGVYFLYAGFKREDYTALGLSGLALGLAIGTKSTVLLMLPGLGLVSLLLVFRTRRWRQFAAWIAACAVGTLVFGLYVYVMNVVVFGNVFGPDQFVNSHTEADYSRLDLLETNLPRYVYQFVDFSGLPYAVAQPFITLKREVFTALFAGAPAHDGLFRAEYLDFWRWPHEDLAWFGPLGFLVLLPGLVIGLRRQNIYVAGLVVMAVAFLLVHSAAQGWTPFKGRYYILMGTVAAPLLAWPLHYRAGRWLVTLLALVVLFGAVGFNPRKPTLGSGAIWGMDDVSQRTLTNEQLAPVIRAVNAHVPPDGHIGVAVQGHWEYPYFGDDLGRVLIPLDMRHRPFASLDALAASGVTFFIGETPAIYDRPLPDYLLVNERILDDVSNTAGYRQLATGDGIILFVRER